MSAKSEAQVISMLQDYVELFIDGMVGYLEGTFETDLENVSAEIELGDDEPEMELQRAALAQLRAAGQAFYNAGRAFSATIAPTLGRLAGSPNPLGPADQQISEFNDYLIDNSKAVKSRGLTINAWSAGGSNVGNGRVVTITTDLEGDAMDLAHPDSSLRMRCFKAKGPGVRAGEEQFEITGQASTWPWDDQGIGSDGRGYNPQYGYGINELASNQAKTNSGALSPQLVSISGGSSKNLLTNGDIEDAALSTTATNTAKYNGITFVDSTDAGNVELFTDYSGSPAGSSPTVIKGSNALMIKGDTTFYFLLPERAIKPKTAIAFGAIVQKYVDTSGTISGTLTIKLIDDTTTHATTTVNISSGLSDNTNTNADKAFIMPSNIGNNLRIQVDVASYSSNDTDNRLMMDEFYACEMPLLDGHRHVAIISGTTDWKVDDLFTSSTTSTDAGKNQHFFNRVFGRYVKHAGTAVDFTDPS